jgi:hypothetical protein
MVGKPEVMMRIGFAGITSGLRVSQHQSGETSPKADLWTEQFPVCSESISQ